MGHKNSAHGFHVFVEVHAFEIARELFDAVDFASALDLDSNGPPVGIAAQQLHGADVGEVLALDEAKVIGNRSWIRGQQLLQMRLNSVFLQTWVLAEFMS
ncbi:unannotated protein [freshwater metagenome]|uniref:Unannotated protein n=1 Tax=freshwater metagenome TaxID=449393 RepID=A0A6J7JIZ2_9ZZZZ